MNRYFILISFMCLLFLDLPFANAQKESKLNVDLYLRLMEIPIAERPQTEIPLLLRGDIPKIKALVSEKGGLFKYSAGSIAAVRLSAQQILDYTQKSYIYRMEAYRAPMHYFSNPEDSIMQQNNNVFGAHEGWGDLPQGYEGEGVLVGIIDDGFELEHPDFLDENGLTRVIDLWDQNVYDFDFPMEYYGYGSDWDAIAIDAGDCIHQAGTHGTHVAGLAVGNGQAANKYQGIAPKSPIAVVDVLQGVDWMTGFVDGIHYFFEKADEMQLPCAVNSSLGAYVSGHDGLDLYSQLIDTMLEEKAGRVFVQAGGNSREYTYHLGIDASEDTVFTRFEQHSSGRTLFYMYGDTAEMNQVDFSFQLMDGTTQEIKTQTRTYNLNTDIQYGVSIGTFSDLLFFDQNGSAVYLNIYTSIYDETYETLIMLNYNNPDDIWQFTVTGEGYFDIWSDELHTGTSEIVAGINHPKYINPDNKQTIAGFWACSQNAITVAAYQNRDSLANYQGNTVPLSSYPNTFPKYGIWFRSSLGPTRDGRFKPEIGAPGGQAMAAAPLRCLPPNSCGIIGYDVVDVDGWHVSNQGTSMAAPMVAGAAALYLQCQPNADFVEVREALKTSAKLDSFVLRQTGGTPNIHWGWGKLDVYELMHKCLVYGCTDTVALNYNPQANIMDTTVCLYLMTEVADNERLIEYRIMPNPARDYVQIEYTLAEQMQLIEIELVDVLGRTVFSQHQGQGSGYLILDISTLASGVYFVKCNVDGVLRRVNKLQVEH
ncbi:MAG: S8 family peptidase [Saprospiraceae bacterium]|nr:S8 family peptidase [Saprospiraceae bacterium]